MGGTFPLFLTGAHAVHNKMSYGAGSVGGLWIPGKSWKSAVESNGGRDFTKKAEAFVRSVDRMYPSSGELMWRNFLAGLFFGLGTSVGLSIVLAILTYLVSALSAYPWFRQVFNFIHIRKLLKQ